VKIIVEWPFRDCSLGETATPMNALHELPSAFIHTGPPGHRICELQWMHFMNSQVHSFIWDLQDIGYVNSQVHSLIFLNEYLRNLNECTWEFTCTMSIHSMNEFALAWSALLVDSEHTRTFSLSHRHTHTQTHTQWGGRDSEKSARYSMYCSKWL